MHVLHLRNSDRLGGPERLLLDQAALAADDVRHTFASFESRGSDHPFLDAARRAGVNTLSIPQRGSYDLMRLAALKRQVTRLAPDVLVGHDYKANALALALGGRVPRVAVVHGYTRESARVRLFETLDQAFLRRHAAVVVVSAPLRKAVLARGVRPERIHQIGNAIRADQVAGEAASGREALRRTWGLEPETCCVMALGRLSPEKAQDVLLEAFAQVAPSTRMHLVLVGDGVQRAALEARAEALGLRRRITFAGWRGDPAACLGAADVFVLPSRREGLPLALLEAMACACPVIATRVGAVPEVVDEGADGLLVDPEDVSGLAAALATLVSDPKARAQLGARGRARVRASYDARGQARALESLYREVGTR